MTFESFVIEKLSVLKAKLIAANLNIRKYIAGEKLLDAMYVRGWNEANEGFLFGLKTYEQKDIPIKIGERETKSDTPVFTYNNEISPFENIRIFRRDIVYGYSFPYSNETIEFTDRNGQTFVCSIAMANILIQEYNKQFLGEWHPELFVFRVKE